MLLIKTESFNNAHVLLVPLGNATDYSVYQKSTALYVSESDQISGLTLYSLLDLVVGL